MSTASANPNDNDPERTRRWIEARMPVWQKLAEQLQRLESDRTASPALVNDALRLYPELARDIAMLRRIAPAGQLVGMLEGTYARLHQLVYQPPRNNREMLRNLVRYEVPAILREMRHRIVAVTLLFILSGLGGAALIQANPDLVQLFASSEMITNVENGELWTDGLLNIAPSSLISIGIFTNNISVAFLSIAIGVLFGLGTIYIIGFNGFMLGAMFAFTAQHDLAGRLFQFVVAHGFVELSAIVLCGAAGFALGEALARPGVYTRRQAFRIAAGKAARIGMVCAVFLVGAGVIEGYVSPDPRFPLSIRLLIGLGYEVLFIWILAGMPGRRARNQSPAGSRVITASNQIVRSG